MAGPFLEREDSIIWPLPMYMPTWETALGSPTAPRRPQASKIRSPGWISETLTREAPMAGGQLFEAVLHVSVPGGTDPGAAREALERLASEILVDLTVGDQTAATT